MKTNLWIYILCCGITLTRTTSAGPYAPAATNKNSEAYATASQGFIGWATGYTNYVLGIDETDDLGINPGYIDPEWACGPAYCTTDLPYDVVVLGGGGQITMTFDLPIADGAGFDFAVFENAFNDCFLELAYVEVSSDGVHFFRFSNESLTSDPIDQYAHSNQADPTDLHGFASKYRAGYGTPFDLHHLPDHEHLNKDNVRFVKIIDIIGDGRNTDSSGRPIYDPYPTGGFPGFDLDAVGIINTYNPILCERNTEQLDITFTALENRTYSIEYKDDLRSPNTTTVVSEFTGNGQPFHYVIDLSGNAGFYVVKEVYQK